MLTMFFIFSVFFRFCAVRYSKLAISSAFERTKIHRISYRIVSCFRPHRMHCTRCGLLLQTTVCRFVAGYSAPGRWRSIAISVSVCLSVCLSVRSFISKTYPSSPNFLYMLTVAVARSSSYGNAIRYVLPVLCF